jgi:hypothetical protein
MNPRAVISAVIIPMLARHLARHGADGVVTVSSSGLMPVAGYPRPQWQWSDCGNCGGRTRPGLPCSGCGWVLGAITPEQAAAAGVDAEGEGFEPPRASPPN